MGILVDEHRQDKVKERVNFFVSEEVIQVEIFDLLH